MPAKVRGLLAKAESTEFPEEAEALTAKAQQLMDAPYNRSPTHVRDREGWAHGAAAANRAQLHGQAGALR